MRLARSKTLVRASPAADVWVEYADFMKHDSRPNQQTVVHRGRNHSRFRRVVRHQSREVNLKGDLKSKAKIKALQWDAFGSTVLHVDLMPCD